MLTVLQGEALTILKTLPAESVQACVTSPPYWGLRDYGTAAWDGGDSGCDHSTPRSRGDDIRPGDKQGTSAGSRPNTQTVCKCGATRVDSQLGLEPTPEAYVAALVGVMAEVKRVLRHDGTLWLNLGDSYAGGGNNRGNNSPLSEKQASNGGATGQCADHAKNIRAIAGLKPKDLCGIPWSVAFALRADGWWLRQDIIWAKPNPMPESVTDRPTKSHEYIFLLTKSEKYYYDAEAIKEPHATGDRPDKWEGRQYHGKGPAFDDGRRNGNVRQYQLDPSGRNKRSVWSIPTNPYPDAHFATYPSALITPMILAGSRVGDTILDPFAGSGTTGKVAIELARHATLIELNPTYVNLIQQRCSTTIGLPLA